MRRNTIIKIFLIISFLFSTNTQFLFSQTERKKILVGITSTITNTGLPRFGFQTEKRKGDGFESDTEKTLNLNLSPKVGFFLFDKWAFGVEGNFSFLSKKNDSVFGDDITGTFFLAGPFVRYYLGQNNVRPFAEVGALLGKGKFKFDDPDPNGFDRTLNSNHFSYGGGVGIATLLGNKVSIDTILAYNSFIDKSTDDNPDNERTITSGIYIKLGFSLYLD